MNAQDQLATVKAMILISGNYHDTALYAYIAEAKDYMISAGVKAEVVDSEAAIGVIAGIVSDLFQSDPGKAQISPHNQSRVIQLCYRPPEPEPEPEPEPVIEEGVE